jgi:peptide/nickel transport system substrate-binding protein
MHVRSKRLTGLVALGASALLVIAACSSKSGGTQQKGPQYSPGYAECQNKPDDCNSGPRKDGGQLIVALGKVLPNFNVNASDGNLVELVEVMNLILPSTYNFMPSGKAQWNTDLLASEPQVTSQNPQTVVYKIRPEATWDDGTPITADDFTYAWKTQRGTDKNIDIAGSTGYEQIKSVTGSDSGKTVTVVYDKPYPDWVGLFGGLYPAHIAAKAGDLNTDAGLEAAFKAQYAQPTWTGGAYKISAYDKTTQISLVPNPKWYGKDKPTLTQVVFKFITDPSQQVPALKNQEIQGFNVQPNRDIYDQLQSMQNVQYEITAGYSWEHLTFNTKNKFLTDQKLREAIMDVVDRQAIVDKTVKPYFPSAKPLGNHMFVSTAQGYKDNYSAVAPDQGNGKVDAGKKILTDAGYTGVGTALKTKNGEPVVLTLRSTGTAARQQTAELLQSQLKQLGITLNYKVTTDLSGTLDGHDYDIILFGFSGSSLLNGNLDIWRTDGGNNFTLWGDPKVDELLQDMSTNLDQAKRIDDLNQADVIAIKAAVDLPLFDKPNLQVITKDFVNIRDNNAGSYFSYNSQQWGVKAS